MLAAGRSSRMPTAHKLLLPFPDEAHPVLRRSVDTAIATSVGPVAVVLPIGEEGAALARVLFGLPVEILPNPDAAAGLSTSVRLALAWARARAQALVLLLADEPAVRAEAILGLVEAWPESDAPALRIRYRDRPGHPVLLRLAALEGSESELLHGDRGLRAWLSAAHAPVEVDADAPIDIDTPQDYRAALARLPQ